MSTPYERTGRTNQKARTRNALIAAARQLLTEGVSPTVERTADRAAVSRTTAFRYFPNQRALLAATYPQLEAESLLIALDLEGVAVSTGSACSSGSLEPSHVLRAMGLPTHRTQNSIRVSLGAGTTDAEVDYFLEKLPKVVEKLRTVTGVRR